ncbi:MAG: FTR1 family protein [Rickettsiales bacterium]
MLATLIIVFRELIEAGLIVGIVLAATRGVPQRGRWVGYGIGGGILGACIVALFANTIASAMEGMGQEIFNASVLSLAVVMLAWHNIWMARHGREMAQEMKTVGHEVATGKRSLFALAIVVGIAVLREGSEIVLFLYGIAISGGKDVAASMLLGGALGVVSGIALSMMIYFGLLRIPTRYLFSVTSALIALLAAGMAAKAIAFLQQSGTLTALSDTVWDTSNILSEGSTFGSALNTLIGYIDRPNEMQLIAYLGTLAVIFGLMRVFKPAPRATAV